MLRPLAPSLDRTSACRLRATTLKEAGRIRRICAREVRRRHHPATGPAGRSPSKPTKPGARTRDLQRGRPANVRCPRIAFALGATPAFNVDIHPGISAVATLNAIDRPCRNCSNRISGRSTCASNWTAQSRGYARRAVPATYRHRLRQHDPRHDRTVAVTTQISVSQRAQLAAVVPAGHSHRAQLSQQPRRPARKTNRRTAWEHSYQKHPRNRARNRQSPPEGSSETVHPASQSTTGTGRERPSCARNAQNAASRPPAPKSSQYAKQEQTVVRRNLTFREAASVIVHPERQGIPSVRATFANTRKFRISLPSHHRASSRQVFDRATIAEVKSPTTTSKGIDWSNTLGKLSLDACKTLARTSPPACSSLVPTMRRPGRSIRASSTCSKASARSKCCPVQN